MIWLVGFNSVDDDRSLRFIGAYAMCLAIFCCLGCGGVGGLLVVAYLAGWLCLFVVAVGFF